MAEPDQTAGHEERPLGRTGLAGSVPPQRLETEQEPSDAAELKLRLAIKNNRLRELSEELAQARGYAGRFQAARENLEETIQSLEGERDRMTERIRQLEEEARRQDRSREELDREYGERETENEELRATVAELRQRLEEEYELRRQLAEPENRVRAGVELFNESEHLGAVSSLSKSMGQPEVHVSLGEGEEPPAILSFTWQGIAWQTYASNPGLAVEEPRVYLQSSGEDLSGVETEAPNARIGPGERLYLGL